MRSFSVLMSFAFISCAHQPAQPPAPVSQEGSERASQPRSVPTPPSRPASPPTIQPALRQANIYFDFDSAMLSTDAREAAQSFFEALQARPDAHIRIEGNCDERGTVEYNLALGQRRADAVKHYLVNLGLRPLRISAISNGKEKPRASGHDEEAWRENRRGDLLPEPEAVGQR